MNKKFHLEISEPMLIYQGQPGDDRWGRNQFPLMMKTEAGGYYAAWEYGTDTIYYESVLREAVSDDGVSWRSKNENDKIVYYHKSKDGNYFAGFLRKGTHKIDYHTKYTPILEGKNGGKRFFASQIEESDDKEVYGIEIDGKTGEERIFTCKINWPYMALGMPTSDEVYPATMVFALSQRSGIISVGDRMYYCLYTHGFNSDATCDEDAILPYPNCGGVYVLYSDDCGHTWNYLSEVLVDDSSFNADAGFEGFVEPSMCLMPDGSFVMLIRTGCNHPSYITRSADNCKSWSKPEIFDDIGVLPQILALNCGVTIASYGRPVFKVRGTSDPAGLEWEEPIVIPLSGYDGHGDVRESCYYTDLLPISDTEAFLIHSDFHYKNPDGIGVKSILYRKIKVIFDE